MLKQLKISTVFFICFAFIVRILYVNVGFVSAFSSQQANKLVAKHLTTFQKKRRQSCTAVQTNLKDYTAAEFFAEERSGNEENLAKATTPSVLFVANASLKQLMFSPKSNFLSDFIHHDPVSKRFLALSVIRV